MHYVDELFRYFALGPRVWAASFAGMWMNFDTRLYLVPGAVPGCSTQWCDMLANDVLYSFTLSACVNGNHAHIVLHV